MWRRYWPGALILLALAAATRIPWAGLTWGEPDGARYLLGLEQWLRLGPQAPFIYAHELSPGYYAFAARWVRLTGARPVQVLDATSLVAALISAPLLYWIGCQLTTRAVAAAGTVLMLLAPAYWWLGLEPHPEQVALLLAFAAMAAAWQPGSTWKTVAAFSFGLALLCKADLILLAGIFPALAWRKSLDARKLVSSIWIPLAAGLIFLGGRAWIEGQALIESQRQTSAAVREFLQLPHGVEALKQLMPLVFAAGLAAIALIAWGVARGVATNANWRRRWLWLVLAWSGPGIVFWLLIQGNSVRHIVPYVLLPLWAALENVTGLDRPHAWRLATITGVVVLANWLIVPANSNLTLYPSANVPASARDLARLTQEQRQWLQVSLAATPETACILGNGTVPYLEQILWDSSTPKPAMSRQAAAEKLNTRFTADMAWSRGRVQFVEANNSSEYRSGAAACVAWGSTAESMEFTPSGLRRQVWGREWRNLPLARHWYPGTPALAPAAIP